MADATPARPIVADRCAALASAAVHESEQHSERCGIACVTGRFQPVHHQHLELFALALQQHEHLVVAITNPDSAARHREETSQHRHTAAANPFSYFERARLLSAVLTGSGFAERTTLVPFDLTRPQHWPDYVPLPAHHFVRAFSDWERQKGDWLRDAGYRVTVLDGDADAKISASDIRGAIGDGRPWEHAVPEAARPVLRALLAAR